MSEEHPDELLSALLDGELLLVEAEAVRAHVVACSACAAELEAVREARASVRTLPGLALPPALVPRAPAPPARRPTAATTAAGAVALLLAVLLVGALGDSPAGAVAPGLRAAVDRHAAAAALVGHGGAGRLAPFATSPVALRSLGATRPAAWLPTPARLGGYTLAGVFTSGAFTSGDAVQLVYERGPFALSVFEVEGRLDRRQLPAAGTRLADGTWRWDSAAVGSRVVVAQRGDVVITVVGDESPAAVLAAAAAYPAVVRRDLLSRLTRGCDRAFRSLLPD